MFLDQFDNKFAQFLKLISSTRCRTLSKTKWFIWSKLLTCRTIATQKGQVTNQVPFVPNDTWVAIVFNRRKAHCMYNIQICILLFVRIYLPSLLTPTTVPIIVQFQIYKEYICLRMHRSYSFCNTTCICKFSDLFYLPQRTISRYTVPPGLCLVCYNEHPSGRPNWSLSL